MQKSFIHRRKIVFGDCDPGGIVYTPRVSHFVVEAGLDFLHEGIGGPGLKAMAADGYFPPARAMHIEFLNPMTWDEELELHIWVKEVRDSAFVLSGAAYVGDQIKFKSEFTQVCISAETFKPIPIPQPLREALLKAAAKTNTAA